jgi:ATP-binding cassette, subfamily B (MDR/TAP), member 1
MRRHSTDEDESAASSPASSTFKLPLSATQDSIPAPTLHSQPKPISPSIKLLFSFLTRHDLLFLVLPAVAASMASGAVAPFMTLVIGKVFDAFANFPLSNASENDRHELLHAVGLTAIELVGLAVGALGLGSVTSSLWIWTGERNLLAVRKRVYAAVTRKDLVWFDSQAGKDTEDSSLGAGGLMAKFTR